MVYSLSALQPAENLETIADGSLEYLQSILFYLKECNCKIERHHTRRWFVW